MILKPEFLNRVYTQWRLEERKRLNSDFIPNRWDYQRSYQYENRTSVFHQHFESWLFEQGFIVIQEHRERYLKFSGDEKNLTLFILKHGIAT